MRDRSVIFTVYVSDPALASSIELEAIEHSTARVSVELVSVDEDDGTASFKVEGIQKSLERFDVMLEATANGLRDVHYVSVVVPDHFGEHDPCWSEQVTVGVMSLDTSTIPAFVTVPPNYHLRVALVGWTIPVPVCDQFNDPIGDIYAGAVITEKWGNQFYPTNVSLDDTSTYPDYLAIAEYVDVDSNNNPIAREGSAQSDQGQQDANNVPRPVKFGIKGPINDTKQVRVDGFDIGSTGTRTLTFTPDPPPFSDKGMLTIVWDQE